VVREVVLGRVGQVGQVGLVGQIGSVAVAFALISTFRIVTISSAEQPPSGGVPCVHSGPIVRDHVRPPEMVQGEALRPDLVHSGIALPDRPTVARIEVRVDESGRVTSGCIAGPDPVSPQVQASLIEAAMRVRFRPAIQNGQPVPSVAIVEFRFSDVAYDEVKHSSDVAWLTRIADSESYAHQLSGGIFHVKSRQLRTMAYVRLGELGSDEALAGISSVERALRDLRIDRPFSDVEVWPFAAQFTQDWDAAALVESDAPNGIRYRIFMHPFLSDHPELLVAWSRTPADRSSWSRPRLIDAGFRVFAADEGRIGWLNDTTAVLRFRERQPDRNGYMRGGRRRTVRLSIPDITRDRDGDGWTDVEERRLGLNPSKPDTDGDGLTDGVDTCPLLPRTAANAESDEAQMVQRAFLATFGFSDARQILHVPSAIPAVHLFGYPGPIFFGGTMTERDLFMERVRWTISSRTESTAEIEMIGNGFGMTWRLRHLLQGWFVVGGGTSWVA
jgi:hypothetical protein